MAQTADREQAKPSFASVCEGQAAKGILEAVRKWHEAGKPHKR